MGGSLQKMAAGLCFREAYPNCTVLEARPCYNVARLMFLDAERYWGWAREGKYCCPSARGGGHLAAT